MWEAGNSQGEAEVLELMQGLERGRRTGFHASNQQEIIAELRDSIFQFFLLESSHGCWFESRLEPGREGVARGSWNLLSLYQAVAGGTLELWGYLACSQQNYAWLEAGRERRGSKGHARSLAGRMFPAL